MSSGGKTARDPKEVQQTLSVLTAQQIQDQNITDVDQALTEVPGIMLENYGSFSYVYSRGFLVNAVQYDGGSPGLLNSWVQPPDLAEFDHVEVLRGADGLFGGTGAAGGSINLVRKRPLDHDQVLFDVTGGSWKYGRAQLDATGPLGFDGRLRGRIVAAYEDRHYFYDTAKQNKTKIYGVLEADVTDSTLVTFGGGIERKNTLPFVYGLPRYSNRR